MRYSGGGDDFVGTTVPTSNISRIKCICLKSAISCDFLSSIEICDLKTNLFFVIIFILVNIISIKRE